LLLFPETDECRPRSRAQRRRDTEHRLTHDIDVWVASASADGAPYLVPLSFDWDGEALLVATPTDSPTGRNLLAGQLLVVAGHELRVSAAEGAVMQEDADLGLLFAHWSSFVKTRARIPGAQDRTGGEIRGRPWGELAAARGDFRWPPTGRISWPPTGVEPAAIRHEVARLRGSTI
jgi:Pyridoxamine 5''-phosphate oxidase.